MTCPQFKTLAPAALVLAALAATNANAAVYYEKTNLGGVTWQYVIDVVNDESFPVNAFRFLMPYDPLFHSFPDDGFANLTQVTPPIGNWLTSVQFEISFLLPQTYDVANNQVLGVPAGFNAVLAPGGVLDDIVLQFDWDPAVSPAPGSFTWEFYEAPPPDGELNMLATGRAILRDPGPNPNPNPTPEPASLALLSLGMGLVGLAVGRRRRPRGV